MKSSFFDYTLDDLSFFFKNNNFSTLNANYLYKQIYQGKIINVYKFKDISKKCLTFIKKTINFNFNILIIKKLKDNTERTVKFLFQLQDGNKIETVLMKFEYGYTICVSSQVGCNMGCKFCASGKLKKIRNLEASEIIQQIIIANKYLSNSKQENIKNVVFMGIGEPFDNYDNVKKALQIITNHFGLGIGETHITVSTCGLTKKILTFGKDFPSINLAISLHASDDNIRSSIMPINNAYDIKSLISSLKKYQTLTKRQITIEYLLLNNVNDTIDDAHKLIKLLKNLDVYINLISYNIVSGVHFKKSDNLDMFIKTLSSHKIKVISRSPRGFKINAACGQLRSKNE